ncbi:MAG: gliding motility-associated C-terminal domain-containing protein [Sphingobacteriales bacterium]|nr:gliding motility-associated C-terminal domain-containing protein [Sphingobacteriales bacterium]
MTIFLLIPGIDSSLFATHIVGGVMNYRYVGNDRYEISLYVYRDCIYGIPPLDDPAYIRVWDGVSESVYGFSKPFDDTLPPLQPDPCSRIETPVCVNWTRYLDTLVLPPNDLGYTIYYQRCCRNNTILNLTYDSRGYGAMDWGATYTINIPPSLANEHITNASPYFVNYPPVYICVNKPITYDNSVIDTDGDSLVYRLCTPYSGAFPYDPANYYTTEFPPFENVVWDSSYSESNMLGGVPLAVHPVNGLLTGTPNTIGQFVVGICVDEYRNGTLLTRTIRDFQFNVVDCNLQIISSFFAPTIQCNDFTVNFQNQSSGATSYKWYFGDGDSSTLDNPTHTYTGAGTYTVTLICYNSVSNSCIANYSKTISVQFKRIEADFNVDVDACLQRGDIIRFIDRSTDSFNVAGWKWNFSTGDSSSLQNPVLSYNGNDTILTATLLVTSTNGCTSTITKTIRLFKKPPYAITPVITKCSNVQTAQLELSMQGNNIFQWSPTTGLNNPNIQNPNTNTNTNITYYVTIKTPLSNGDTCFQRDSVQVKTINTVQINASDTTKVCSDSVRLSVPISTGQSVIWSTSATFNPVIGTTGSIAVAQSAPSRKYFVKITAQGCEATDSIIALYSNTIPQIALEDNILQCSNQLSITAGIDFADQVIWSASPTFNPVLSAENPLIAVQIPKTVKYYIKADYKTCSNTDSIKVTIQDTLPSIALSDSLSICGEDIVISAVVRKFTSLIWSDSPTFSSVIGTTGTLVVFQSNPRQVYYLKAFYRDCFVTDSIIVNYNSNPPTIDLADSAFICSNTIRASAVVNNAGQITWSVNPTFTPVLSNQASFIIAQTAPLKTYYIKAAYQFCSVTDSIQIRIPDKLTSIDLSDSAFVCKDSVRILAHISNYDSLTWFGSINFDEVLSHDSILVTVQSEPQKTYYLKAYYAGCETIDSIAVFYNDTLPSIRINRDKLLYCEDSVSTSATVDFNTTLTWSTDPDFNHVISADSSFTYVQTDSVQWYYFRATYNFCYVIDSIKLEKQNIRYAAENKSVCLGDSLTVRLSVQTHGQYDIKWMTESDTLETSDTDSIHIKPNQSHTLYFSVINTYGCSVDDSLLITVHPLPTVSATVDKPVIFTGEQVQLTVTQDEEYSYNWTPSSLVSQTNIFNPVSSPTETTVYTVSVNTSDNCIGQDTVSVQVLESVCDKNLVFIPNAFTPNGDKVNDEFKVRASTLKNIQLVIYDRWGNKVFESDDIHKGWDGTYKGQPALLDAYGYFFTGQCLQGEKISLKGNVTLLR